MGWFDEQIKQRKASDEDVFEDSFVNIAGAVMGHKMTAAFKDKSIITKNAIDEILKFYHVKSREIPPKMESAEEQLEFLMRPYGIMRRVVNLEDGFYKDAIGAMLAIHEKTGNVVALIPGDFGGYSYTNPETGVREKITAKNEGEFDREAFAFYLPFPLKSLSMKDMVRYILSTLNKGDVCVIALATLIVTLIGLLVPKINNVLFSQVLKSRDINLLAAVGVCLICITISSSIFTAIKTLLLGRINTKLSVSVEAAAMMRVLSLPADFFKKYSAGELANRIQYVNVLCMNLVDIVLETSLTSLFSLLYLSQIFLYAKALVIPSLLVILVTVIVSALSTVVQMKVTRELMLHSSKESGMTYALISGIQKIKLAGAEKRAFARWGNLYAEHASLTFNPPTFLKINAVIATAISLLGTIIMYYSAVVNHVSVADYVAFNVAYGMVSGAFLSLAGVAISLANIKPIMEMVEPIFKAIPEIAENKLVVDKLSGGIELNHVSFRYNENMPYVIEDLSLKIRPGQYVAIVGKTGCGKSTLIRLLLGFEQPQKGAIYYDGKDINRLDLKSLRQKIGVVMQNGSLMQGDIFSNISISAPFMTLDEAWEAAETAGIADDIQAMPMGMFTVVAEGGGGISGGQKQRLMIARAIAPKPKILMLDEATSALDNITQKQISEALDQLKCTRIVIAHRLSTIKQCDRIIVLDGGNIVEDGTYDELIALNGEFAELVKRQRLDL